MGIDTNLSNITTVCKILQCIEEKGIKLSDKKMFWDNLNFALSNANCVQNYVTSKLCGKKIQRALFSGQFSTQFVLEHTK